MPPWTFSDKERSDSNKPPANTPIRHRHIEELRSAIDRWYTHYGQSPKWGPNKSPGKVEIKRSHWLELKNAIDQMAQESGAQYGISWPADFPNPGVPIKRDHLRALRDNVDYIADGFCYTCDYCDSEWVDCGQCDVTEDHGCYGADYTCMTADGAMMCDMCDSPDTCSCEAPEDTCTCEPPSDMYCWACNATWDVDCGGGDMQCDTCDSPDTCSCEAPSDTCNCQSPNDMKCNCDYPDNTWCYTCETNTGCGGTCDVETTYCNKCDGVANRVE